MTNKQIAIGVGAALVIGVALGRFLTPVTVETKTVEVERKDAKTDTDLERDGHKETITKETVRPNGTKKTTTRTVEDTTTRKKTTEQVTTVKSTETQAVKDYGSSRVTIVALVSTNIRAPGLLDYGLGVSRPILGPFVLGVYGFKSGVVGVSLGLQF